MMISGTAGSLVGSLKPYAINAAPEMVSLILRASFLAIRSATTAAVSEEWFRNMRPMYQSIAVSNECLERDATESRNPTVSQAIGLLVAFINAPGSTSFHNLGPIGACPCLLATMI